MDFSEKNLPAIRNNNSPHEYQAVKLKHIERQFDFTWEAWMHDLAMTVSEPIAVFAWMVQSKKYGVSWDEETRTMNFTDDGIKKWKWAEWGLSKVRAYLGNEIYNCFGVVKF